jgi:predicted lipid-binding transport protein (Tim44 family)
MKQLFRLRPLLAALLLAAPIAMVAVDADARAGRGGGFGSRGSRTWSTPAPSTVAPRPGGIERSMQQPTTPGTPGMASRAPTTAPTSGGFFNRMGFGGGLMTGLLGAGLIGMLFGGGLFSGLGSLASFLGLALQLVLVFFVARWVIGMFRRRNEPAYAGAPSGSSGRAEMQPAQSPVKMASASGAPAGYGAGQQSEVQLGQADYDEFERLLGEVQTAYGRQDLETLRRNVTPEVVSYMSNDLSEDASQGVVNRISDVKLLDGDLVEAWREADKEYVTVGMRYSLNDRMENRDTGELVEQGPPEAAELWTFMRSRGGRWILSAVQQADQD